MFVDVGAAGPDYLSMSAHFRDHGWRVILVEPNPHFCEMHRAAGHEVQQYACADYDADDVPFSIVDAERAPYRDGHVTFESFSSIAIKPSYRAVLPDLPSREIRVQVRRLDTILREHAADVSRIDVLSIDVEGWELEVLRGLSLDRFRPKVVIVENFVNEATYPQFMHAAGYVIWKFSAPNEVYVRREVFLPIVGWALGARTQAREAVPASAPCAHERAARRTLRRMKNQFRNRLLAAAAAAVAAP